MSIPLLNSPFQLPAYLLLAIEIEVVALPLVPVNTLPTQYSATVAGIFGFPSSKGFKQPA